MLPTERKAVFMLQIYLTKDFLIGEWAELPISEDEAEKAKERIGINRYDRDSVINDYKTNIEGIEIGEFENLDDLNELVQNIEESFYQESL